MDASKEHNEPERQGMPWTDDELKKLKKMSKNGYTHKQMAKKLKRTAQAIRSQCWVKDIDVKNKEKPPEWANPENRKNRKFVRNTRKWDIGNRILYGILLAEDIKLSKLAEEMDVSTRTVQRWVYEGLNPNEKNTKELCQLLNISEHILFGKPAFEKSKITKSN